MEVFLHTEAECRSKEMNTAPAYTGISALLSTYIKLRLSNAFKMALLHWRVCTVLFKLFNNNIYHTDFAIEYFV